MDPGDGVAEDAIFNIWTRTRMWSFNAGRPQSGALFAIMQLQRAKKETSSSKTGVTTFKFIPLGPKNRKQVEFYLKNMRKTCQIKTFETDLRVQKNQMGRF